MQAIEKEADASGLTYEQMVENASMAPRISGRKLHVIRSDDSPRQS
jgi:hypothetical protein